MLSARSLARPRNHSIDGMAFSVASCPAMMHVLQLTAVALWVCAAAAAIPCGCCCSDLGWACLNTTKHVGDHAAEQGGREQAGARSSDCVAGTAQGASAGGIRSGQQGQGGESSKFRLLVLPPTGLLQQQQLLLLGMTVASSSACVLCMGCGGCMQRAVVPLRTCVACCNCCQFARQAAAADKGNADLAAAANAEVDKLLSLKKQLAEAEEA